MIKRGLLAALALGTVLPMLWRGAAEESRSGIDAKEAPAAQVSTVDAPVGPLSATRKLGVNPGDLDRSGGPIPGAAGEPGVSTSIPLPSRSPELTGFIDFVGGIASALGSTAPQEVHLPLDPASLTFGAPPEPGPPESSTTPVDGPEDQLSASSVSDESPDRTHLGMTIAAAPEPCPLDRELAAPIEPDRVRSIQASSPLQGEAQVRWFMSHWFVGASLGLAASDASASDVDDDLAGLGYATETSLDDSDFAWKLYGGYRFEGPWAVELAIVDLGTIDSTIEANPADLDQFLDDVANVHPFAGAGVALTGVWLPLEYEGLQAGPKAGFWLWQADVDAIAAGNPDVESDEAGIDLVFGAQVSYDVTDLLAARLEWERYQLDENDVDFFSIGVQYSIR